MKYLQCANRPGLEIAIDDEDFERCRGVHWYQASNGYITGKAILHNYILGPGPGVVDHRDGNHFNATRGNLRRCTRQQNNLNRKISGKIPFKGVHLQPTGDRFRALLHLPKSNRPLSLGTWDTPEEAAQAWDMGALIVYDGLEELEFLVLNFPDKQYTTSDFRRLYDRLATPRRRKVT